ncbi:unnamed protein product [Rodentolepis nana]|uniref:Ig-like domain-containing protein n=1 Tax=Rodentolepis nana TaxID=102285 RepID=A0A0R3T3E1_RODNA|nr:unnamed protein product [Rodentolepis nana]
MSMISRLVVQNFKSSNKGTYTCSKKNSIPDTPDPTPAKVELIMRPRLLADFTSLSRTETNEVVMTGHRVSVPLEVGNVGRLVCRTNKKFKGPIRVTWFYHGRQLIGPAASMLEEVNLASSKNADAKPGENKLKSKQKQLTSVNGDDVRMGDSELNPMKKFTNAMFRPAVIDPAELGVSLENNSQIITHRFKKVVTIAIISAKSRNTKSVVRLDSQNLFSLKSVK